MSTNRIAMLFPAHGELDLFEASHAGNRFRSGCRVRVCSGTMAGVEGKVLAYCGASRLVIAVDLSCQGVTLEIDEQMLTSLDD